MTEERNCGLLTSAEKMAVDRDLGTTNWSALREKYCPECAGDKNNCPITQKLESKKNNWANSWKPGVVKIEDPAP